MQGMPKGTPQVVLLPLEKNAKRLSFRVRQNQPADPAPAAPPIVGFFKPVGLVRPGLVKAVELVLFQQCFMFGRNKDLQRDPRLSIVGRRSAMKFFEQILGSVACRSEEHTS